jgi:hypothetical protein
MYLDTFVKHNRLAYPEKIHGVIKFDKNRGAKLREQRGRHG